MKAQNLDAYRYFFPAGWLLGIWGVLLWILFPWNLVSYPGFIHPELMMGGFFLCFACGFLMTAAPRFTDSYGPSKSDHLISGLLIALLFLSLALPKLYFYAVVSGLFVFLMTYVAKRFVSRRSNPPDAFIFVGAGLWVGLLGSLILLLRELIELPQPIHLLGRQFFLQAYIMCLVIGVGSRLVPALLGWAALPSEKVKSQGVLKYIVVAIAFIATYVVESAGYGGEANLLRAVVLSYIFLVLWRLYQLPKRRAVQTWWLWISAWMILLPQWGIVFAPAYRIHLLHVLLVSGLALMTFMVVVRVSLSHGKHDMNLEKRSKALFIGAFLICLAGFTRLSASFAPEIYQSHLVYAAYTWILALVIWGLKFLPKVVFLSESANDKNA